MPCEFGYTNFRNFHQFMNSITYGGVNELELFFLILNFAIRDTLRGLVAWFWHGLRFLVSCKLELYGLLCCTGFLLVVNLPNFILIVPANTCWWTLKLTIFNNVVNKAKETSELVFNFDCSFMLNLIPILSTSYSDSTHYLCELPVEEWMN